VDKSSQRCDRRTSSTDSRPDRHLCPAFSCIADYTCWSHSGRRTQRLCTAVKSEQQSTVLALLMHDSHGCILFWKRPQNNLIISNSDGALFKVNQKSLTPKSAPILYLVHSVIIISCIQCLPFSRLNEHRTLPFNTTLHRPIC
jgi:hypothetical protein